MQTVTGSISKSNNARDLAHEQRVQPECSQSHATTTPFTRKLIDSEYVPGLRRMMQPGVAAATASEIERNTGWDAAGRGGAAALE